MNILHNTDDVLHTTDVIPPLNTFQCTDEILSILKILHSTAQTFLRVILEKASISSWKFTGPKLPDWYSKYVAGFLLQKGRGLLTEGTVVALLDTQATHRTTSVQSDTCNGISTGLNPRLTHFVCFRWQTTDCLTHNKQVTVIICKKYEDGNCES